MEDVAREAEQRGKPFTSTELLTGARALAEAIEQIEVESSQESKANDVRRIGHKPTGHENSVIIYEPAKASASDKVVPTVLVQSRPGLSDRYSAEEFPDKILNQPRRILVMVFSLAIPTIDGRDRSSRRFCHRYPFGSKG